MVTRTQIDGKTFVHVRVRIPERVLRVLRARGESVNRSAVKILTFMLRPEMERKIVDSYLDIPRYLSLTACHVSYVSKEVTLYLPEDMVRKIDDLCAEIQREKHVFVTRSSLIRHIITMYLMLFEQDLVSREHQQAPSGEALSHQSETVCSQQRT